MKRLIPIIILALTTSCVKKKITPKVVIKPQLPGVVIKPGTQTQPQSQPAPQTPPMMGGAMLTQMAPIVFSYSLGVGGYWIWSKDFQPGEWVKFIVTTEDGSSYTLEIAFLKRTPEGLEWWRVSYIPARNPGESLVYEALFTHDLGELKRLRGKFDDREPQELPVTQGSYVGKPVKLTKESIEGATVGVETVRVPAGTFRAKHVRYGSISGNGSVEWWIDEGVPGGVVRYVVRDHGRVVVTADLVSFGKGAKSVLGSF